MGMGGVDKWCIDGLQFSKDKSRQGSLTKAPWIYHLGDDRSGSSEAGEFIKVNLDQCHNIKRMCVYAFIYEGVPSWDKTDAVVTVSVPGQSPIEVAMGNQARSETFCVIATLEFSEDGNITVTRNVTFHDNGHGGADHAYGWGMSWGAGRK
jgi:tellurite resistance protein TerA